MIPQVILYHDAADRNVWRSEDEGKSWKLLDGIPQGEAWSVVEHPFNSRTVGNASLTSGCQGNADVPSSQSGLCAVERYQTL